MFDGYRLLTARWVAATFVNVISFLKRATVVCGSCGAKIEPLMAFDMVMSGGCLYCNNKRLAFGVSKAWPRWVVVAVAALAFLGVFVGIAALAPVGCDYHIFKNAARSVMVGRSRLFDGGAFGFYYAPWALLLYVPLSFLPDWISSSLLNVISLVAILVGIRLLVGRAPWWSILIAVSNIWTANLLGATQFDALTLAALGLAWCSARARRPVLLGGMLSIVAAKPTNAWMAAVVILLYALTQRWSRREWARVFFIPALALGVSIAISGWRWPLRYWYFVNAFPANAGYNVSFWRPTTAIEGLLEIAAVAAAALALGVSIVHGIDGVTVALALVANLMFSPYVTIYHYVLTTPIMAWVGKKESLWLVFLYAASVAWVIIREPYLPLFPAAVAVAGLVVTLQERGKMTLATGPAPLAASR